MTRTQRLTRIAALEEAVKRKAAQGPSRYAGMDESELAALYDELLGGPLDPEEEARLEAMTPNELAALYDQLLTDS